MNSIQLPSSNPITLGFGKQPGYSLNDGFHKGIDFAFSPDPYAYLPEDGQLGLIYNNGNDGNAAYLWADNRKHALCHLERFLVSPGWHKRGTKVGIIGDTGAAEGRHLHWAIQVDGTLIDGRTLIGGKGGNDMQITREELDRLFRSQFYKRAATDDDWYQYKDQSLTVILDAIDRSPERRQINEIVWAAQEGRTAQMATPRQLAAERMLDAIEQAINVK